MCMEKLLSLCIPTNGVVEWVFPVLDSIYHDGVDFELFEVIVTDNGNNKIFAEKMQAYAACHANLIYRKTEAELFLNQIEAFKLADGKFIKFVNHRTVFLSGALNYLINFVQENNQSAPGIYFLNGQLKMKNRITKYGTFDDYVKGLSYYSSWSGGTAIWKTDFEKIDLNQQFNRFFPHMDIVFSEHDKKEYIIDNTALCRELPFDSSKKGSYDLFFAFGVAFVNAIHDLAKQGYVTEDTLEKVRQDNKSFLAELYLLYIILKRPCSYDLTNYKQSLDIYYAEAEIRKDAYKLQENCRMLAERLEQCINTNENNVIFGAGVIGKLVYEYFSYHHRDVALVVDNDKQKWGKKLYHTRICSLQEGAERYPDANYMIANAGCEAEMEAQLLAMGVHKSRIIMCNDERLLQQMVQNASLMKV